MNKQPHASRIIFWGHNGPAMNIRDKLIMDKCNSRSNTAECNPTQREKSDIVRQCGSTPKLRLILILFQFHVTLMSVEET